MKLFALALVTVAAMSAGACTPSVNNGGPLTGPNAQVSTSGSSSGGAHRDSVAAIGDGDREPAGGMRAERGIPTPQPARDPSMVAIPVPQPPLPGPEPHHGGNAHGRDARW